MLNLTLLLLSLAQSQVAPGHVDPVFIAMGVASTWITDTDKLESEALMRMEESATERAQSHERAEALRIFKVTVQQALGELSRVIQSFRAG